MNLIALVSSLKHPSYTGRARDPGFVVANVLAVSLVAVAVERVVPLSGTVLIVVGMVLLAVRGYVLPGTPWFVRVVGSRCREPRPVDTTAWDEQELLRAGVLTRTDGDFQPTESFLTHWRAHVSAAGPRADDHRALAVALGVDPARVRLEWRDGVLCAEAGGTQLGAWLSRAALVADTASIHVLRRQHPSWDRFSPWRRGAILSTLRLYLDVCPGCDGITVLDRAPSRRPNVGGRTVAVTCAACDARLFESGFDTSVALVGDDTSPSMVGR
jgi:hypothetical protein